MSDTTQSDGSIVETKIEVNLNRLTQLFNSLDPSRFTSATLIRTPKTTLLVRPKRAPASALFGLSSTCPLTNYPIPVPPISQRPFTITSLIAKLTKRRRLRLLFRDGRIALFTGLAFLPTCMLLRELAFSFGSGTTPHITARGC
jgi:hypothetical protein